MNWNKAKSHCHSDVHRRKEKNENENRDQHPNPPDLRAKNAIIALTCINYSAQF